MLILSRKEVGKSKIRSMIRESIATDETERTGWLLALFLDAYMNGSRSQTTARQGVARSSTVNHISLLKATPNNKPGRGPSPSEPPRKVEGLGLPKPLHHPHRVEILGLPDELLPPHQMAKQPSRSSPSTHFIYPIRKPRPPPL